MIDVLVHNDAISITKDRFMSMKIQRIHIPIVFKRKSMTNQKHRNQG